MLRETGMNYGSRYIYDFFYEEDEYDILEMLINAIDVSPKKGKLGGFAAKEGFMPEDVEAWDILKTISVFGYLPVGSEILGFHQEFQPIIEEGFAGIGSMVIIWDVSGSNFYNNVMTNKKICVPYGMRISHDNYSLLKEASMIRYLVENAEKRGDYISMIVTPQEGLSDSSMAKSSSVYGLNLFADKASSVECGEYFYEHIVLLMTDKADEFASKVIEAYENTIRRYPECKGKYLILNNCDDGLIGVPIDAKLYKDKKEYRIPLFYHTKKSYGSWSGSYMNLNYILITSLMQQVGMGEERVKEKRGVFSISDVVPSLFFTRSTDYAKIKDALLQHYPLENTSPHYCSQTNGTDIENWLFIVSFLMCHRNTIGAAGKRPTVFLFTDFGYSSMFSSHGLPIHVWSALSEVYDIYIMHITQPPEYQEQDNLDEIREEIRQGNQITSNFAGNTYGAASSVYAIRPSRCTMWIEGEYLSRGQTYKTESFSVQLDINYLAKGQAISISEMIANSKHMDSVEISEITIHTVKYAPYQIAGQRPANLQYDLTGQIAIGEGTEQRTIDRMNEKIAEIGGEKIKYVHLFGENMIQQFIAAVEKDKKWYADYMDLLGKIQGGM